MKKWIIIIFMILWVTTFTVADKGLIETYKPNEVFDLSIHLTNKTSNVEGANCDVQIRNESYNITLSDDMNEIGDGWYNYTYNTSKVGKYFCMQNCTKDNLYAAETCDFIIEGDAKMDIAIMIGLGIFAVILGALAIASEALILRAFFGILTLGVIIISINTAKLIAEAGGAASGIVSMLNTAYFVGIYLLYTIVAIAAIYGLWQAVVYLKDTSGLVREKPNIYKRKYNFRPR